MDGLLDTIQLDYIQFLMPSIFGAKAKFQPFFLDMKDIWEQLEPLSKELPIHIKQNCELKVPHQAGNTFTLKKIIPFFDQTQQNDRKFQ